MLYISKLDKKSIILYKIKQFYLINKLLTNLEINRQYILHIYVVFVSISYTYSIVLSYKLKFHFFWCFPAYKKI